MQFVVPQFIEVESKIIGPISARQFVIILITLGVAFLWYSILSLVLFIPALVLTCIIGGAMAFAKVNGQSMHYVVLNLVQTLRRPRLKLWARVPYSEQQETTQVVPTQAQSIQKEVTQSHLAAMSLMVDTGGMYATEDVLRNGNATTKGSSTPNTAAATPAPVGASGTNNLLQR